MLLDLLINTTNRGNIDIKSFRGDKLLLTSESGNITTENCHNKDVKYTSQSGNIISNGSLYAGNIKMETKESGVSFNITLCFYQVFFWFGLYFRLFS